MPNIEMRIEAIQVMLLKKYLVPKNKRLELSWLGKTAKSLFIFLFFYLGLTTQKEVWESVMSQVSHSHITWWVIW